MPAETLDTEGVQIVMIAAAHGMNTDAYTIPYVATWAARAKGQDPVTTVQQTAARVRAAALRTLEQLQTPQTPDGAPEQAQEHAAKSRRRSPGRVPPATKTDGGRVRREANGPVQVKEPGL